MLDIYALHTKSKIGWVKRLNTTPKSKWSLLMWYMLNIGKHLINYKLPHSYSEKWWTPFHEQWVNCWLLAPVLNQSTQMRSMKNTFSTKTLFVQLNKNQFMLNRDNNKDIKLKSLFNENGRPNSYVALKNLAGI